jgi:hypothetical protein
MFRFCKRKYSHRVRKQHEVMDKRTPYISNKAVQISSVD